MELSFIYSIPIPITHMTLHLKIKRVGERREKCENFGDLILTK